LIDLVRNFILGWVQGSHFPLRFLLLFCVLISTALASPANAQSGQALSESRAKSEPQAKHSGIWENDLGGGFRKCRMDASLAAGIGFGVKAFGSRTAHSLTLTSIDIGWITSHLLAPGKWYAGNVECRIEIFGGGQFKPDVSQFVGLAPFLRYDFATGSRWVPYVELGAGVSETDIGGPDLSTSFEFNLQTGFGTHYFFADNEALTLRYRFLHLSNAGIDFPNAGVNTQVFSLGVTWFF